MTIKELLGKRIKELRKQRRLTQEQVAEYVGIETNSLSNIETGRFYPTSENLEKIMTILEVKPKDIFEYEHLQPPEVLMEEVSSMMKANPDKIKVFYKIAKAYYN